MKRSPLRRVSQAKRREASETGPHRAFYVAAAGGFCEACERPAELECHEIVGGQNRHKAVYKPNLWLALCRECHERLQGRAYGEQLAVKCEAIRRDINQVKGSRVV